MPTFSQIFQSFREGGPVMWPILVLSVVGLAIVFDRLYAFIAFFRSRERHPDPQAALNRLQRGFGFLSTIITAEPMLGILGTVTGIIQTFGALKVSDAASPPCGDGRHRRGAHHHGGGPHRHADPRFPLQLPARLARQGDRPP